MAPAADTLCLNLKIAGSTKNLCSLSHAKTASYGHQRGTKFFAWVNRMLDVVPYGEPGFFAIGIDNLLFTSFATLRSMPHSHKR
jgi:hypothetical protein